MDELLRLYSLSQVQERSNDEFEEFGRQNQNSLYGGIIFQQDYDYKDNLLPSLDYIIRFQEKYSTVRTGYLFDPWSFPGPRMSYTGKLILN